MADDSGEIAREGAEAVDFANIKILGDAPAFYAQLAMANAVANQNAQNLLGHAIVSKAAEQIMSTTPAEGSADTAAAQVLAKMAGNTPPVTP